ncbi:MAG: glycine zipper family protein [Pseudomonadota bacterium]
MKRHLILPIVAAVSACAHSGANYTPILDGTPTAAFQSDLAACQSLARSQNQFDQETIGATVLGAGAGAVLGEADDDGDALGGAIAGAVAGGVAGAVNASERREAIVVECLRGRGHRVVG